MVSFTALSKTLHLLLLTLPALAVSVALPSSKNDPFRAIVLAHRKHEPEPPLCCLTPPPSIEPLDDVEDVLLSFEEWKSKQFQSQSKPQSQTQPRVTAHPQIEALEHTESSATHETNVTVPDTSAHLPEIALSPHFRVPITDRFNYANLDCSARVHTSHRSAKYSSSILSSKKDKYMLSPCSSSKEEQFVVVELCEDIRIDTVQLANFEFFSGVFKDFSVKVAKTYTTSDDGWVLAGTYKGKNVRGAQSFHTPTTLRDFYRYIRIDFHSHYGHEYYCPVSLLRVYGLTHLEQWKWDMWEEESHKLARAQAQAFSSITEPLPISSGGSELNKFMDELEARNIPSAYPPNTPLPTTKVLSTAHMSLSNSQQSKAVSGTSSSVNSSVQSTASPLAISLTDSATVQQPTPSATSTSVLSSDTNVTSSFDTAKSSTASLSPNESTSTRSQNLISSELSHTSNMDASLSQSLSSSLSSHHSSSANTLSTALPTLPTPPPVGSGGESIYRTIMTRLTFLEANHSLYARYVEEQTAGVREVLRRLGEDVGRLQSISRIQAQMYQRTVHEWERQRLRLEFEHSELLSRVNHLAEEVTLEKRLGIAQLCLLLAVLVFIGLTRGAPSIEPPQLVTRSAREWGRRNLSFASSNAERGSNNLLFRSRSPEIPVGKRSEPQKDRPSRLDSPVDFPSHRAQRSSDHDPIPRRPPHFIAFADKRSTPRGSTTKRSGPPFANFALRTPTRRIPNSNSTEISTLPRAAHMVRTNSHSSTGLIIPKSTKRLARTAHLHEVKGSLSRRENRSSKPGERENDFEDVFRGPSMKTHHHSRRPLFPVDLSHQPKDVISEDTTDPDAWVDTDVEGGSECSEFSALDPSL
ncbi:UNC-like C-terminal-domain-containing protein [Suillus bovinus]|uniref:UNC-like C-terminal-domain-containing protein n=1 Tax=Suillus bovinus TaxID=48563 RepID=UPI001B8762FF|nr:UNC-like C-terminal-domain-containing protein [Suillus bovinus]KAG2140251.1 UNC-like C-terminal-domain-containing protein [Suillus bovinus]